MSTSPAAVIRSDISSDRSPVPWFAILLVAVSFFLIEHETKASLEYQEVMTARSLEEIEGIASMFQQTMLRQVGGLALGGFAALLFILQGRKEGMGRAGLFGGLIILFIAWNYLSVTWSHDPGVTMRRLLLFTFLAAAAFAFARYFSVRDIMLMGLWAPLLYVLIGVGAEIKNGAFEPWVGGYRFCGTMHPNHQAWNTALLFLSSASLAIASRRHKFFYVLIAVIGLAFLVLTKSRTAMASVMFALSAYWGLTMAGGKKIALVSLGVAAVSLLFLFGPVLIPRLQDAATLGREDVSENFGTLTGRTKLWTQCLDFASERPVLGYGYGAFWTEEISTEVIEKQGWPISHAHNAYLDTLLETGPIGVFLFTILLLLALARTYGAQRATGNLGYGYLGVVLTFCLANSFLESATIQRTMLSFLLMLVLAHLAFWGVVEEDESPAVEPQDGGTGDNAADVPAGAGA